MYPDLLKIGSFTLHSFGVMVMLAFLIPTLIMWREFDRRGIAPELAIYISSAAIVGGFVGARLYFIFEYWEQFLRDPWQMLFSGSGLVWYGGFLGGFLAVYWVVARSGVSKLVAGDVIMPLLLLGHAIGRVGCQLAGDGDYGPPSDLPWAMAYPNGTIPTAVPVHPTPVYDTLLALLFFGIIWSRRQQLLPPGRAMSYALFGMGIARFITEFFRNTPKILFGWMTLAQIISIAVVAIGAVLLVSIRRQAARPAAVPQPVPEGSQTE